MKILYSGFADPTHSSNGGYDKIINICSEKKILLKHNYFLGKLPGKYHLSKIPLWLLDFHTRLLRYRYDITHLFYGEITQFPFLPYRKSNKHKTVITLHLDIEQQHLHSIFLKNLSAFDGIIVLSTQQQKFYKEKYNIDTTFIPHGFDTPIFTSKVPKDVNGHSIDTSKINLITSGKNYRDFDTLEMAIKQSSEFPKLHFHIVGAPQTIKNTLSKYGHNVSIYNRISDDEYYTLIQSCDYNFLPLTFATANNALLEAQSLGIRSILPDMPGISDYGAPSPMNIYYFNSDNLLNILHGVDKSSVCHDIIDYSKRFSWENIYQELMIFYNKL